MNQFPPQKKSSSEKNEEWKKDCVNAIISWTNFGSLGTSATWRDNIHKYYDYYNGVIDDGDYTHVLKPFGTTRKGFPAKLHNYPIIKPVVDLLLGEKVKRPRNYSVIVANPDVIDRRKEAIFGAVKQNLIEHFRAEIMRLQGEQVEEPPMPQEVKALAERTYKDHRALVGQQVLEYVNYDKELDQQFSKGWKDWLIAGLVFSYKDVVAGDLVYDILNPLDVDYDKSPDVDYIEDGEWAAFRKIVTPSDVVKAFWDVLTPSQIDEIYGKRERDPMLVRTDDNRNGETLREDGVEVVKVFWKSLKKYRTIIYEDEWGITRTRDEDEEYEIMPGEEIRDVWIPEVWQGTRINKSIYVNIKPHPIQRSRLNQKGDCKLPINGRKYSDRNSENISLVALGVAFQLTYNIYKFRLENEIAKAKGMVAQIDLSLIPADWKLEQFLNYLDATGIVFYQSEVEGKTRPSNTHKQVLDLSVKAIDQYIVLLQSILDEWERLSGVTRQRQGMMSPYDGKGTSEQSIVQSSHITEDLYARFEAFEQREYQGLLDLSKVVYAKGLKAMYVSPEGYQAYTEVDGAVHAEGEYGVFITGGAKEQQKIETLRAFGQQLSAGGNVPVSMLADIIESDNFVQLKEKIAATEAHIQQLQQQQQEAQQQMEQQKMQMEQAKLEHESVEKEKDRQTQIQVALIAHPPEGPEDNSVDYAKLSLEERKRLDDRSSDTTNSRIAEKTRQDQRALKEKELKLKSKEIAAKKDEQAQKLQMDQKMHEQKMRQQKEQHALKLKQQKSAPKK